MSRDLLPFFEQELAFLHTEAKEFARDNPRQASLLRLEPGGGSTDPHVERMIQAVAALTARVRLKIDDDFPELTDALLSLLYPHYLAPLPSMTIARVLPNPGADLVKGLRIPRHTRFRCTPVNRVACEFRSVYPVRLWPIGVAAAELGRPSYPDIDAVLRNAFPDPKVGREETRSRLKLTFQVTNREAIKELHLGEPDADRQPAALRLFLNGEPDVTATLYEMLFNNVTGVVFRDPGNNTLVRVPAADAVRPVGFRCRRAAARPEDGEDEGVLPYPDHAFPGYRLLTEFFAYRNKFLFLDLAGWDAARGKELLQQKTVEVHFFFNRTVTPELENEVNAGVFLTGCVPLVNLVSQRDTKRHTEAETITAQRYQYPLTVDKDNPDGYEIYSVDRVFCQSDDGETEFEPFYSFRHQDRDRGRRYWLPRRRASNRRVFPRPDDVGKAPADRAADKAPPDRGTEVDIHFVNLDFDPAAPDASVRAMAQVTYLNRDLPTKLRDNPDAWSLSPVTLSIPGSIQVVKFPTPTLRPMQVRVTKGNAAETSPKMSYWRLVSHLALNHLSLVHGDDGRDALREYLSLYDFADDSVPEMRQVGQQVRDGIEKVSSRREVAFVAGDTVSGFARGTEITIELDEDRYAGVGVFLFASVLERFFGLYASMNSFTKLVLKTRQRGVVRTWQPRAGDRPLV